MVTAHCWASGVGASGPPATGTTARWTLNLRERARIATPARMASPLPRSLGMIGDTKSKPLRVIGAALRCKDLVRHRREIPQDLAYPSIGDPCLRPAAPIPQSRFLRDPLSSMDQVAALHDGADHKEMEEKSD